MNYGKYIGKGMEILIEKLGIDAGGTFLKLAFEENGRLHTKFFLTDKIEEAITWINLLAPNAKKMVTGGLTDKIEKLIAEVTSISEFEATSKGASFLLNTEYKKSLDRHIVVSIGTGTSILLTESNHTCRLLGTGIGGGTFTGLGMIITGESQYENLIEMASSGNRHMVDFIVSDIYKQGLASLHGDLTASNFGKVTSRSNVSNNDSMASLVNMIAETICLLVSNAAAKHQIKEVIFVGGGISKNDPLKKAIHKYQNLLGLDTYFLASGQYAGAIGALYS